MAIKTKKCKHCKKTLSVFMFLWNKTGTGRQQLCIECTELTRPKNTCLYCGSPDIPKRARFCPSIKGVQNCSYQYNRALAIAGKKEPNEIRTCVICGQEYPFFSFLNNRYTCSTTHDTHCGRILTKNQKHKKTSLKTHYAWIELEESTRYPECLQHPQCVDYVECLDNNFKRYTGKCYRAPAGNSVCTKSIHAFVGQY